VSAPENAPPVAITPEAARTARLAGQRLLAAAGAFLLALVCAVVGGSTSGTAEAEDAAAARLGVNPVELPAQVLAEIHRGESPLGAALVALPFLAAAVLLYRGVSAGAQVAAPALRGPATLSMALAAVSALAWGYVQVAGPFYTDVLQLFVFPAVIVSTASGCAALVALALVVRGSSLARRTAATVAVLGAAATIGAFIAVPPFAPYVLGVALASGLVRTHASPTM
jgi:hypothetical protein